MPPADQPSPFDLLREAVVRTRETPEQIPDGVHCRKCRYQLRGLSPEGNCPECGTPCALSTRLTPLERESPEWRSSLWTGLLLLTVALLWKLVYEIGTAALVAIYAPPVLTPGYSPNMGQQPVALPRQSWPFLMLLGGLVTFSALCRLAWQRLARSPQFPATRVLLESPRRFLSAAICLFIATSLLTLVLTFMRSQPDPDLLDDLIWTEYVAALVHAFAYIATIVLMFWFFMRVADGYIDQRLNMSVWRCLTAFGLLTAGSLVISIAGVPATIGNPPTPGNPWTDDIFNIVSCFVPVLMLLIPILWYRMLARTRHLLLHSADFAHLRPRRASAS